MRKTYFSFVIFLCLFTLKVSAQSLYKVSLDEKVINATLIVEGKVIRQHSFWNPQHTMIFTSNTIELTKVFKGNVISSTIEILTQGGSVGTESIEASDLLTLSKDQVGIFFCFPNTIGLKSPQSKKLLFDVYSSSQGFFAYDLATEKATAPFVQYNNISDHLYTELQVKTGRQMKNLKPEFSPRDIRRQQRTLAVSITGFSPSRVNAGALLDPSTNLLTITGSGFGTASGNAAVLFDDANDGSGGTAFTVAYNDPLIVSWSDVQIQVRVPSRAGTGTFQVRDASGNTGNSPSQLTVLYSILTASFSINSVVYTKESNLMNSNNTGGYTILYSTNTAGNALDFDASSAKATFQRALITWKEVNGLNVQEGGTTTVQAVGNDGNNVIMFDNANTGQSPLASGVLAVCYSYNSMCTADLTNFQARKLGFDIVVRNSGYSTGATTFSLGPCPPNASNFNETDLETVLLHELGHALNLGHINDSYQGGSVGSINPGKLMNYAVVNSVKRVSPDYSAKAGATYAIFQQGNSYGTCTAINTEMIPLSVISESKDDCPATFPTSPTPQNTTVTFNLVHATSNLNVDPAYTQVRCDGVGASQTNNAYYAFRTNSLGGTVSLAVTGYTTNPASLASCTQVYASIPVTGIRMSIYQANSCPTAGSFGTPVACRTFSGNGALTSITGLTANTRYLMMVEGIENTKATFNVVFSGGALPIKLSEFTGKALSNHNFLQWKADAVINVSRLIVQKSINGNSFEDLTEFRNTNEMFAGSTKDYSPYDKTFYRLKIINADGNIEFSNVITIQRENLHLVSIYPNPAQNQLTVQINSTEKANYTIKLFNNIGQSIKELSFLSANTQVIIPAHNISEGVYQLVVFKNGIKTETHSVLIKR
jgi:hypothetical protein